MPRPLVTVYTHPDCHLCDVAKQRIGNVGRRFAFDVECLDVSASPELESAYRERIPVVSVDGEEACVYRVNEKRLARILADHGARPRGWRRLLTIVRRTRSDSP